MERVIGALGVLAVIGVSLAVELGIDALQARHARRRTVA